jgi:hypothetical protein
LRLEIRLSIVRASRTSAGECGCLGALKNLARQVCSVRARATFVLA